MAASLCWIYLLEVRIKYNHNNNNNNNNNKNSNKLCRPHWILISLIPDGTRRHCPFDGVVWVSVVLLCWHRLPICLPPLALRNSRHLFFHLVFVISRTVTLQLHCSSGLHLRHHHLRLYRRQFQRYSSIGIIHVAKFNMKNFWTMLLTQLIEHGFLLRVLLGQEIGSTHCRCLLLVWRWTTPQYE